MWLKLTPPLQLAIGVLIISLFFFIGHQTDAKRYFKTLNLNLNGINETNPNPALLKDRELTAPSNDDCLSEKNKMKENDDKLRLLMEKQKKDRQTLMGDFSRPNAINPDWGAFYNGIIHEIVCPWLVRVGNVNDGGKWTCTPWALPKNCVIYSLGVGPDITFEIQLDEVAEQRCKTYSFDGNPFLGQRLVNMKSERFNFRPYYIKQKTTQAWRQYTVESIMEEFNHTFIDFFKVDIEGSEFTILPSMLKQRDKPIACQIFIEMHGSPAQHGQLHLQLSKAGFYLFFYEINFAFRGLSEFSFMHESCFRRYGVSVVLSRNFPD